MANLTSTAMLLTATAFLFAIQQGSFAEPTLSDRKPWIAQTAGTKQWLKAHFERDRQFQNLGTADLVFVGDSLTEFWTSMGKAVWDNEFSKRGIRAANAGISADRTENIIWRMQRGKATSLNPKGYIVMAGTNNLAMRVPNSPEDTAKGVEGIVVTLQRATPGAQVLVLSITPNGFDPSLAARIQETNEILKEMVSNKENVMFLDVWPVFKSETNTLKPELTVDGTHFNAEGYARLAEVIRPVWMTWMKKR